MAYRIVETPPGAEKPTVGGRSRSRWGNRVAHRPVGRYRIARRLGVACRLVTLLEGESLINDASALVAYRLAVSAVVAGSFSPCGRRVRHLPGAVRSLRAAPTASSRSRRSRSEDGWSRSGTPGTLLRSLSDQVQLSAL
jgi:hypothetical protein